eukprot:scaffold8049_cov286-Pinguiococcus_pyrenoidosus.AAC.6
MSGLRLRRTVLPPPPPPAAPLPAPPPAPPSAPPLPPLLSPHRHRHPRVAQASRHLRQPLESGLRLCACAPEGLSRASSGCAADTSPAVDLRRARFFISLPHLCVAIQARVASMSLTRHVRYDEGDGNVIRLRLMAVNKVPGGGIPAQTHDGFLECFKLFCVLTEHLRTPDS